MHLALSTRGINNHLSIYLRLLLWQRDGLQLELGLWSNTVKPIIMHTMQHTCISLQGLQFCVTVLE